MAPNKELQLVVKHTFLEYAPYGGCSSPQRMRSQTEPETWAPVANSEVYRPIGQDSFQEQQGAFANLPLVLETPEATPVLHHTMPQHGMPPFMQLEEPMVPHAAPYYAEHFAWDTTGCGTWLMALQDDYNYGWTSSSQQEASSSAPSVQQQPLQSSGCDSPASHSTRASTVADEEWRTTVMLRDVPEEYKRADLLRLLDQEGFFGRFDFAYLPIDFKSHNNLGYALINMVTTAEALRLFKHFEGFSKWGAAIAVSSQRTCSVKWCNPHQGLEVHVERYRNSPVMHSSIRPEWQPLLLSHGVPVAFPPPTMHIKAPKVKGMK